MTVILTGATGFIGKNFTSRARAAGISVAPLLRAETDSASLPGGLAHDGSVEQMAKILIAEKATAIVHCAAAFSPTDDPAQTDALLAANIDFPVRLLQAARIASVRKWLNIGSLWEHNASGNRDPVNLYASMKTAFEDILTYTSHAHGISSITLKLSDTYGPDDTRPKLIPGLKSLIDTGETLQMTAATQTVSYCHVYDVCDAMLLACQMLDSNQPGHQMYVVEGDEPMVLRDMIASVLSELEGRLSVDFDAVPIHGRKPVVPWIGGPRLPGWSPKISLKEGLIGLLTASNHGK